MNTSKSIYTPQPRVSNAQPASPEDSNLDHRHSASIPRETTIGSHEKPPQSEDPLTPTRPPVHTRKVTEVEPTGPDVEVRPFSKPQPPLASSVKKKRSLLYTRPSHGEHVDKKLRTSRLPNPPSKIDFSGFSGPSIDPNPSPLFFSNSPQVRPELPARFSSAEAAAKMLSKAKGEDSGIKTVSLARGTSAPGSPPSSRYSPRSRSSLDRLGTPKAGTGSMDKPEISRTIGEIGITELFENDPRPVLIVDLDDAANYQNGPLHPAYINGAMRSYPGLLDRLSGNIQEPQTGLSPPRESYPFKVWILSRPNVEDLSQRPQPFKHLGFVWSCTTLRARIRIAYGQGVGALEHSPPSLTSQPSSSVLESSSSIPSAENRSSSDHSVGGKIAKIAEESHDYFGSGAIASAALTASSRQTPQIISSIETNDTRREHSESQGSPMILTPSIQMILEGEPPYSGSPLGHQQDLGCFDWTRLLNTDALPKHIQFARSVDWAATSLGPIENWSADLRQMCNLIMASPHPAAMYWGDDFIAIYNEAYVLLAGQKHPKLMGQSYREAWAEIWNDIEEVFVSAKTTGQATMKDDDCLFLARNQFLEETYFSWSIIPLVGRDGTVMGLYNPAFEKTRRKIAERRMLTLREVGEKTATARDIKGFWREVLSALEYNEYDTPFVLIYSVNDESESDSSSAHSSSMTGTKQCNLEGTLGVPTGHEAAPSCIDLKFGNEGFGPLFRESMWTNKPILRDFGKGELPAKLVEGMEWRGFGDPSRSVVVCPVHPTTSETPLGFLVMGINPRRPYDDDYGLFIQLLSRQLATSLASVVLFEEEIKRGQRAARLAAMDRFELSEQLAARTQEAIESETKFTRMAEFAPVGMFIADADGHVTYCNDMWYDISRVPKDAGSTDKWLDYIIDEDKPLATQVWNDLITNGEACTTEFRFKTPWRGSDRTLGDTWVLFSAYPEKWDDGTLKSVFGSITNISQQKWAEGFQKLKMEEAVELKRQQENFIDITSHEMRNPLSAILQCADMILNTFHDIKAKPSTKLDAAAIDSNIDAAQTIALCGMHQKRIIDDILTMSKLDSALVMVTPVDVQPLTVVQRALKMFEGELQTADIQMQFVIDESFKKLGIDWVRCDPFRVLQILINLTTNAIKFTTTERKRTITVTLAASPGRPSEEEKPVVNYIPARARQKDITRDPEWGTGDDVYIQFLVEDTGRGLTDEEMKLLFIRFSQASPRTHVQYGGSGLGLFISRELTELQGGEIGVASEAGKGSTFAFFVKARRSAKPTNPLDHLSIPGAMNRKVSDAKPPTRGPQPPKTRDFAFSANSEDAKEQMKVLLVEDNLVNQKVLAKQLQTRGCIVHVANHGGEALDRLKESNLWLGAGKDAIELNVVLMDQEMPVMDGLTCTKKIRELEHSGMMTGHVPIIAVTANARSEQIQTAIEVGMDDVVSKPFRIQDLLPKMEELVARLSTLSA